MSSSNVTKLASAIALVATGVALTACGGGGGSSTPPATQVSPPPPPPPPQQSITWQQGVFESANTFKDQCQNPRSGTDIEGNTFPDQAGTLADELFWLRSWTEETYLDRKSTRLNSSHLVISYAVFCLKKKKTQT